MNEFAGEYMEKHICQEMEQTGAEIITYWIRDKLFLGILPFLFYYGVQKKNVGIVLVSAALTMVGIIINRWVGFSRVSFNLNRGYK